MGPLPTAAVQGELEPPASDQGGWILATEGEVTVPGRVKTGPATAEPMTPVEEGTSLRLGRGGQVELLGRDRWLTFSGPGEIRFHRGKWTPQGRGTVTANRRLRTGVEKKSELHWSVSHRASDPGGLSIDGPRETAIRDLRPTLRWRKANPRDRTRLDLLAVQDGRLVPVERWRGLTGDALRVHFPLAPETLYMWRVSQETVGVESSDQAWFVVREQARIEPLSDWMRSFEALDSSDPSTRRVAEVILAISLERLGLLAEAQVSWRALASQDDAPSGATRRSLALDRRLLVEPRANPVLPLPFGMRLGP
jgi:hypothetical protein